MMDVSRLVVIQQQRPSLSVTRSKNSTLHLQGAATLCKNNCFSQKA